jgi:hypothetical protein
MANLSEASTLVTPAGNVSFNPASGDGFYLTPDCTGLDAAPIRIVVDDAAQTDGGIVHDAFDGARHALIVAQYLIDSGTIDARDAAIDDLETKLAAIRRADGTWTMTHRGTPRSLTVRCDIGLTSSGGPQLKQVTFGLVAASPAWV